MKKIVMTAFVLMLAALLLTACGSTAGQQSAPSETPAESGSAEAPAVEETPAAEETPAEPAGPGGAAYAWLGLEEMPKCRYLDALASAHYIREYISMSMGYIDDTTTAVDGVNIFSGTEGTRAYTVNGQYLGINDSAKLYWEREDNSSGAEAAQQLADDMASGENRSGRVFVGTGREVIPQYGYYYDDETEYEYYEYRYPANEEYGLTKIERFYMKDGDVFAIYYEQSFNGESLSKVTEVIRSVSTDIPEGIFDFPALDGYEKG